MQLYQSSLGQLGLAYSEEAREHYENAQIESTIGIVLALGGFATCLYGAVAEPQKEKVEPSGREYKRHGLTWERKTAQSPKQTREPIYCLSCKEELSGNAAYCSKCGKKVE